MKISMNFKGSRQKGTKEQSQSYPVQQFHFPADPFRYRTIKNLHNFHELLKNQNINWRRDVGFESTIITNADGSQTLNIQCKQCQAHFKYVSPKKGENFFLKEYSEKHQHVQKQVPHYHQSIIERIETFLQNVEGRQDKQQLLTDICSNYRITDKEFQRLYSQASQRTKRNTLLYDGKEIDELIRKLKTQRFTVYDDFITNKHDRQTKRIIKSIVVINEQMSSNYKRYGDCVYVALDDRNQLNRWYTGAFLGVGRDMEIVLFGLFLLKTVDVEHLKGLFKLYFSSVQVKPETIITQYAPYFETSLLELKKQEYMQCQHLLDYASFVDRFHRKNTKFRKFFAEIAREPQKRKFYVRLNELVHAQNFAEYEVELQELYSYSDRICLSQIPQISISPYRTVRNKISQRKIDFSVIKQFYKILYEKQCQTGKHLYSRIKNVLTFLLGPINQQTAERNRIMDLIPELKEMMPNVSKNVMEYLISKALSTLHLRVVKISEELFKVYDSRVDYLSVKKTEFKWQCECQESLKTKLPCSHQLAVCIKYNKEVEGMIGRRWTNEQQRLEQEQRKKLSKRTKWKRTTISQFLA